MATFIDTVGIRAVAFGLGEYRSGMTQIRRQAFITGNAMIRASNQANTMGNAITSMGATISGVGRNVSILGSQMSNLGIRMATFVTAPIIAAGAAIAKTGGSFESELTKIENLVGVNRDRVAQWREEILRIAPSLGALPAELARGLFFITSAGVRDTTEAIEALEVAAKSSAIGMGEINEIARALAAGMNSFGISAEEAGEVLLATVRESQVEAEELAPVLGRVTPFVEELGGSFQDAGAFIATFTRTGVTASVATTALRSTLTSLIKPTESAKDALKQAGLSVKIMRDLIAEEGLAVALQILRKALEDAGLELGDVITRSRGLVAALALTGEQANTYLEVSDKITGSQNQLASAFERVTETTEFQWNRFVASINVAAQHIADVLLPAVNSIIDRLVPLIEGISRFAQQHEDLVLIGTVMAAIAAAIGPAVFLFGQLFATVGTGIILLGNLVTLLGSLLSPIGLVTGGVIVLSTAFAGLVTVFTATIGDIARKADISMGDLRARMGRWGYEIIRSFAEGMINALTLVVRALNQLSRVFAKLLAPGSPPDLLPELDDWGTAAAQEWVDGWLKADFSIFNDIARQVTGLIRGIGSAGGVEEQDIASAILGSRAGIGEAINQFRETGTITEEVLDQITAGLGESQQIVQDYIVSMFRLQEANEAVERAQENLNAVQQKYNDLLDPLNDELDKINEQQARIRRSDERERLQQILADPRATDEVRRRVRLALNELAIRDRIASIEGRKDEEVSAAEQQLQLAEERAEAIQAQVEVQRELIELIREQIDLIARTRPGDETGGTTEEVAAGGAGGEEELPGGDIGGFGEGFLDTLSSGFGNVLDLFENVRNKIEGTGPGSIPSAISSLVGQLQEDLEPAIAGLNTELEEFSTIWADILVSWEGLEESQIGKTLIQIGDFVANSETNEFFGTMVDLFEDIDPLIRIVAIGMLAIFGGSLLAGVGLAGAAEGALAVLAGFLLLEPVMAGINTAFEVFGETIDFAEEKWDEMVENIKSGDITTIPQSVLNLFLHLGAIILSPILFISAFIVGTFNFIATEVKKIVSKLFDDLVGNSIIPEGIEDIVEAFGPLKDIIEVVDKILNGVGGVISVFEGFVKDVVGSPGAVINKFVNDVRSFIDDNLPGALTLDDITINNIVAAFTSLGDSIAQGIHDGISAWFTHTNINSIANKIYQGLRSGILAAVAYLNNLLGWLNFEVTLPPSIYRSVRREGERRNEGNDTRPGIEGPMGRTIASTPIVPGASTGGGVTIIFEDGSVVINDDMDAQRFGNLIRREVTRAIRGTT